MCAVLQKVVISKTWRQSLGSDALLLPPMGSNLTRGTGHSSAAPHYPRETLRALSLAHAEFGVSEQANVRSDTEALFLPKSEHFSQTDSTLFQLHFIKETNLLLSKVAKGKREGDRNLMFLDFLIQMPSLFSLEFASQASQSL